MAQSGQCPNIWLICHAMAFTLRGEIGVQGQCRRYADVAVNLAMPLADPRHDLGQARNERRQAVRSPAVYALSFFDQPAQG